ncbi:MAG: hypothetical protein QM530_01295 [Phycisphaerales bacterium]|nr:hypothetical protein [Phycisphaerales bacterium]
MMKKLNQYLLENYPLVWNMRLLSVLAVCTLLHLVHFVIGFFTFSTIEGMSYHNPEGMFFDSPFALFSIIGSFIVFILWLIKVLRNNAFKSFYPFSKIQLFAQFLIFFLVALFNITYYFSYTYGYVVSARLHTDIVANTKDNEVLQNVLPFLQGKDSYDIQNRCTPYPFPMNKRFKNEAINDPNNPDKVILPKGYSDNSDHYYIGSDKRIYSPKQLDSIAGGATFSYLNYCSYRYRYNYDSYESQKEELIQKMHKQLKVQPEAIRASMSAFLQVCDKYKIKYKLSVDDWFKWVYHPPYFPVTYTIQNTYYYPQTDAEDAVNEVAVPTPANSEKELNPKGYFVQVDRLECILDNTFKVHEYHIKWNILLVFMYFAMAIALTLFSFRASSKRIWLISLIGSALVCLAVGAITAVLNYGKGNTGSMVLLFYLLLILAFLLVAIISHKKTIAGVTLNWFVWSAPAILPIIYGIYSARYRYIQSQVPAYQYTKPHLLDWIDNHTEVFMSLCILLSFISMLFLSSRYRRWQAMPED